MPNTYEPIATQSPTTSPTEITFSTIPGTYTDLLVVAAVKVSSGNNLYCRVNSDTGTNYSYTYLTGNGTTASSNKGSNGNWGLLLDYTGFPSTDNNHIAIIQINNYANTTTNKTAISRSNRAAVGTDAVVSLWRSTSAITSLTFRWTGAETFSTGTIITLYGIKAA